MKGLRTKVYDYPNKYNNGYIKEEIEALCEELGVKISDFWQNFGVNTCSEREGNTIFYHVDVLRALELLLTNTTQIPWD